MSLTIILSGPKSSASQARNALAAERFDVHPGDHDHGLPAHPVEGKTHKAPQAFITVQGDDVDKALAAVSSLSGWRLRMHHDTPEDAPPNADGELAIRLADLQRQISEIKAGLSGTGLPPIGGGAVESPGFANQNSTYGAEQTRRAIGMLLQRGTTIGSVVGGIIGSGDCALSAPGSGLSVNVAPGEVVVPGSTSATQSGYGCRVSSTSNLAISAADPSLPRVDRVVAVVTDSAYSGVTNTFAVSVITGTATAGATLTNLNGVGAAPASSYTLGYVLVPATSTNVIAANISNIAALAIDGLPSFTYVNGAGATTAVSGQWIEAAAGVTVTLPASPTKGSTVAITAIAGVSGASPVTVAAGTAGAINGLGLTSAASFKLGVPGAPVILEADGSNWWIISGQQDTGWVALPAPSSIQPSGTYAGALAGAYTPAYRVVGNMVYLRGAFTATSPGSVPQANYTTWPAAALPNKTVYYGTNATTAVLYQINSTGSASLLIPTASSGVWYLDGVSYSLI